MLLRSAGLLALSLALASCSSIPRPQAVSVADVVHLSQTGTPAEIIIQRMRDAGMVYRLQGSQLARLHQQGVPDSVLDYMQNTYLEAVRRDQHMNDWNRWWPGPDGFFYGGCFFGAGLYGCH